MITLFLLPVRIAHDVGEAAVYLRLASNMSQYCIMTVILDSQQNEFIVIFALTQQRK